MARSGRKRKIGLRHPSGQLVAKKPEDDRVRTSRQPHRRALAHEMRANGSDSVDVEKVRFGEEAESPIGRLWAAGHLHGGNDVDSQAARNRYDAGNMFAQIVGAYRSSIEAPRDVAGSGRGLPCAADVLCRLEPSKCECTIRKVRYDDAFETLTKVSRAALRAVSRVAVYREPIGMEDLVNLVDGLDALTRLFGLTARPRGQHYRNTK